MNRGTIGFLMNKYSKDNLLERLNNAKITKISPLVMETTNIEGENFGLKKKEKANNLDVSIISEKEIEKMLK